MSASKPSSTSSDGLFIVEALGDARLPPSAAHRFKRLIWPAAQEHAPRLRERQCVKPARHLVVSITPAHPRSVEHAEVAISPEKRRHTRGQHGVIGDRSTALERRHAGHQIILAVADGAEGTPSGRSGPSVRLVTNSQARTPGTSWTLETSRRWRLAACTRSPASRSWRIVAARRRLS